MVKRARQRSPQPSRKPARRAGAAAAKVAPVAGDPGRLERSTNARPAADAVTLFQAGMQALQRHDYTAAGGHFERLLESYPSEGALRERSMVYLVLCQRELARRPTEPRTVEERLTAATAALNNGDDDAAEGFVRTVLRDAPQHDLALYLLAAVEARRGADDEALLLLTRAMSINPEIRAQARHDADFEAIRDLEAFRRLIDSPPGQPMDDYRRTRRSRGDR